MRSTKPAAFNETIFRGFYIYYRLNILDVYLHSKSNCLICFAGKEPCLKMSQL